MKYFLSLICLLIVFSLNAQNLIKDNISAQEWNDDINYLHEKLINIHPNPYFRTPKKQIDQAFEDAMLKVNSRNSDENALEIMRLISLVQDGHSSVGRSFDFNQTMLPIRPYLFDDGLFIIEAKDKSLIGSEIISINGYLPSEFFSDIAEIIPADNIMHQKNLFPFKLIIPELLYTLGITKDPKKTAFTLKKGKDVFDVVLTGETEHEWFSWIHTIEPEKDVPLFRQVNPFSRADSTLYWTEELSENVLYMQYKEVVNRHDYPMKQFAHDLSEKFESTNKFIIDLRECPGGNKNTLGPLFNAIKDSRIDKAGKFYVITGRRTNSAATCFVTDLRSQTNVITVGEGLGGSPNFYSDVINISLPNSKIPVSISTRYQSDSYYADLRRSHLPDIPIAYLSKHHFNNQDPIMDFILEHTVSAEFNTPEINQEKLGTYRLDPLNNLEIHYENDELKLTADRLFDLTLTNTSSRSILVPTNNYDLEIFLDENPDLLKIKIHNQVFLLNKVEADELNAVQLFEKGNVEGGLAKLDSVLIKYPYTHIIPEPLLNNLGYKYLRQGDHKNSILLFKKNTEIWPNSSNVWDSLGEAYFESGDLKNALINYEKSLSINPNSETGLKMIDKIEAEL